jgi:hypothetical protein
MNKIKSFFQKAWNRIQNWWARFTGYLKKPHKSAQVQFENKPKKKRSIFSIAWRIGRILGLAVLGAVIVHNINMETTKLQVQNMVHEQYEQTNVYNVYIDDLHMEEEQITKINNVFSHVPKALLDLINREWIVLISEKCPFESFETDGDILGTTYYASSIIWLSPDAKEHDIAHEVGHVLSFICGEIHNSQEFVTLYKNNWSTYKLASGQSIESHCVSTPSEWFAEMYAEFILEPEYLKQHMPDVYNFMLKIRDNPWRLTRYGRQAGIVDRMLRIVATKFSGWMGDQNFYLKSMGNEIAMWFRPKLTSNDLSYDYLSSFEFQETAGVLELIQNVIAEPNKYGDCVYYNLYGPIEYEVINEVQTVVGCYFLNSDAQIVEYDIAYNGTAFNYSIVFEKSVILSLEAQRCEFLAQLDDVLLNEIKRGNEKEMLMQFMSYLLEKVDVDANATTATFWKERKTNDVVMSMIFQQAAHRLGISCDIRLSPLETGVNHRFNRVTLADGSYVYYDVLNYTAHANDVYHDGLIVYNINNTCP